MRILLLAQWYPPIIGGEEGHVRNLAIGLSERGHQVSVATLVQPGQAAGTEVQDGIPVHRMAGLVQRIDALFSLERRSAQPLPDPGVMRALAAIIARERPDIVHAHNWIVHSMVPLKRWSAAGLVLTLHDYSLACPKKTLVRTSTDGERLCDGPALMKCLRCASRHYGTAKAIPTVLSLFAMKPWEVARIDAIVAVSDAVARWNRLAEIGRPFHVVPNFVTSAHGQSSGELGRWTDLLPAERYLLFVGAFARAKGIEVLLHAYGDGDGLPPLVLIGYPTKDQIMELGKLSPRVSVFIDWPQDAVMEAWRRSLAGVVPSIWRDPCPTVVIEAMLAGKPVIASSIGGLPDLVAAGLSGLLVPPGDWEALREAMRGLTRDADLYARLSSGAAERAAGFTGDTVIPRLEAVYEEVRNGRTEG
jgi:glycosyltransferase involved in cell wall biosynthesis